MGLDRPAHFVEPRARANLVDAIVTAPLSKAALHAAGHHYPGHTELLAERCGVQDFAMMLYLGPDVEQRNWEFLTPGSLVAALLWIASSGLFAVWA